MGTKIKMPSPCYCRPVASQNCMSNGLDAHVMNYEDTGVFVEPKFWEAVGLQVTALPWNPKDTTLCVSPNSSLCICFILPTN